jgi:endonuclease/exonuclease/phosphatase family metal-dependent hydrolase
MKKLLFFSPVVATFLLIAAGLFYTYSSLTKHNPGTRFSQSLTAETEIHDDGLKVLSYNVHGVPNSDSFWCNNLIDIGKELGAMRKAGTAPHVVLIQEGFHKKIKDLIKLSGYPYVEQGPTGSARTMTSGLWVLSEYPIGTNQTTIYSKCGSWDCLSNKGVQYVTIKVPGGGAVHKIEIYNTHMNAKVEYDFWTDLGSVASAKRNQIEEMSSFFRKTHKKGQPAIVAGDFNFLKDSSLYKQFSTAISLNNVAESLLGALAPQLVDHHWFSSDLFPKSFKTLFNQRGFSDHKGLQVEYVLARHMKGFPCPDCL